jgi:acyl-CoA reductase-like NAD-dependent aldehyde dehydrogenase
MCQRNLNALESDYMDTATSKNPVPRISFDAPYVMSIDGKLVTTEKTFDVYNPATNAVLAQAPKGTPEQLEAAVASAKKAFPSWAALSWQARSEYISRFADALDACKEELTTLLTLEQGKPRHSMAKTEVEASIYWVREVAKRQVLPEIVEETEQHRVEVHYTPLGVVGGITPWNFPVLLSLWKVAPCLIMGNTMVLRPSTSTPLCTLRFGELAQQILPPGVLNVITGPSSLGQRMTEHPDIAKISFTGSTDTGKHILASAAGTIKRVTLELGGKDPAIVLPDADIPSIIEPLFWAAFGNSGQWCIGVKRLYVHASIYDTFVKAFVDYAKTKTVGDGMDPKTDFGPIQNRTQYKKVVDLFNDVKQHGYKIILGGDIDESAAGNFLPLTIVDNPPDDSRIVQEEPFGPILPILSYDTIDEVVARANDTTFGLAASVWGGNRDQAIAVAHRIEAGTVWVNEIHIHGIDVPFGGHKQSGLGVENGRGGLICFANSKTYMFKK